MAELLDITALKADNKHLSDRANDLSNKLTQAQKEFKRIDVAEKSAAAANDKAKELEAKVAGLNAENASLKNALASSQEAFRVASAKAARFDDIKNAFSL